MLIVVEGGVELNQCEQPVTCVQRERDEQEQNRQCTHPCNTYSFTSLQWFQSTLSSLHPSPFCLVLAALVHCMCAKHACQWSLTYDIYSSYMYVPCNLPSGPCTQPLSCFHPAKCLPTGKGQTKGESIHTGQLHSMPPPSHISLAPQ